MNQFDCEAFFLENFKLYNSNIALIWNDESFSYSYLLERIDYWKEKFQYLKAGNIVGLESDFSPETISILFSLIYKNVIIVPLDISQSTKNIEKIKIAQLDYLIKVNDEKKINIVDFNESEGKNEIYDSILKSGEPGLVLFTSGSSGKPKGALHDFSKLLLKFQTKRAALLTINFLLFDHWGGLNTLFHILSNGGTLLFLKNRNPDYVCELIEKYKVELLPTSPTFLNMMLLSRSYQRHSLKSLKVISYGAEPMPESVLLQLNTIFPEIKLQQTYGLIELGVLRSKSKENGSLWVQIGGNGYQTRVFDGLLEIKSDSAMIGYLNSPSPFTEDGWFITGDAVEVDGDYFKILGRKSELINVGGEKVYPQEVENIILSIENVLDVKAYGEKHPFTGNIVCVDVFLKDNTDINNSILEIKKICRSKLQSFKVPVKVFVKTQPFYSTRFKKIRSI